MKFFKTLVVSSLALVAASSLAQTKFPVTITHDAGETTITAAPQRIVALHPTSLEILLALGVQPVGLGGYGLMGAQPVGQPATSVPNYNDLLSTKPQHVGIESPSLEAMTALKPDLILTINFAAQNVYPQFSRVAPTLVYQYGVKDGWKRALRDIAQLLGREKSAETLLRGLETQIRTARNRLAPALASGNRVAVVALRGPQLLLTGRGFAPADFLSQLGFRNTAAENAPIFTPASPEALATIIADRVFVLSYGAPKETLESTLELLKRGRVSGKFKGVHTLDVLSASRSGLGPLSDPQMIRAFERAILGGAQ
jgi:iron complex transport system substrate-binding protein